MSSFSATGRDGREPGVLRRLLQQRNAVTFLQQPPWHPGFMRVLPGEDHHPWHPGFMRVLLVEDHPPWHPGFMRVLLVEDHARPAWRSMSSSTATTRWNMPRSPPTTWWCWTGTSPAYTATTSASRSRPGDRPAGC